MINRTLPALLIIISIGIFVLYVNPTYKNSILPLKEEIKRSDSALAAASDFKRKEAQLATERAAISEESVTKINSFLPDGVDNVQLIVDLNALAARSGVRLSNFNIKENRQAGADSPESLLADQGRRGTDSLDLSVTVNGTYGAFRTFLYGVEHSLRLMDVTQIIVTSSATGVYSFDVTFRIYWLH